FYSNSTKIGLLPVALEEADCQAIAEAGAARIDLDAQTVTWGEGESAGFEIDPETKHRLLNALDDIGVTLGDVTAIAEYESSRERPGPVTTAL
ncbi:MAG: 3-isopropylmalate dehydratase small subunit, partial [Solirubrobacterales bacterium]